MRPTVGRVVHYTNLGDADGRYPPEPQAAIITKAVDNGLDDENSFDVSLHIFYTTGQFDMQKVPFSAEYKRGHWSWPPRT